MNYKDYMQELESDCEDYQFTASFKKIKKQAEDLKPQSQQKFYYPLLINRSSTDKCCPNQEFIKKCKQYIQHGDPQRIKYFSFLLKNIENGKISLY